MNVIDTVDRLKALAEALGDLRELGSLSEEDTKRKLIEPFFEAFGWDFESFGEIMVRMEYRTNNGSDKDRADYCFKLENDSILIAEAKAFGGVIGEFEINQLKRYMTLDDCKFGAVTNGSEFEFYCKVDKEFRRFCLFSLSSSIGMSEASISRLLWLHRDQWDIWLTLGSAEFEKVIHRFAMSEAIPENVAESVEVVPQTHASAYETQAKAPRGAAISEKIYQDDVLKILRTRDGLRCKEILTEIQSIYRGQFNEWDLGRQKTGGVRWKTRVMFALQNLKEAGKIRLEDSRYHIWK